MSLRSPPLAGDADYRRQRRPGEHVGPVVVLVDDNSADNLYHRLILEEELDGVEVVELTSGPAAIEYLLDAIRVGRTPNLLLFDLNMPGMSGWEFLDFCRSDVLDACPGLRVAVLSTTENPDDVERAVADPLVDAFVAKPLGPRTVARLLTGLN